LNWGQKFRPAALWENNGNGKAGNIFEQGVFLPAWDSRFSVFIAFFIFLIIV